MIPDPALDELRAACCPERVLTDPAELVPYGFDGTATLNQLPAAVVLPAGTDQVSACLKWATRHQRPVVTRGAGTGLSGGSVPVPGCLVLCLVDMNAILGVDPANLTVRAQAGAVTADIDRAAAEHGLFYPPDPGSMKVSTIGGNIAENSGGLRGLKYGVTRDYVMALEVVLPNGDITRLGSACVKDVAGYSMKDLFVGSEGTLGIITEVVLKLLPKPAARGTLLASFPRMDDAARTVSAIIASRIIPCTLEFLDRTTIRCVEEHSSIGLPLDCDALLLMETDGHSAAVEDEAGAMERIAREHGATSVTRARGEVESLRLAAARRNAFSALARVRPTTILEDVTVPRDKLAEMVGFIAETARRRSLQVGIFGHMGDGNLHPTFLTDERDEREMREVHAALDEIIARTLALGGTITGEHGIGLAKKAWLPDQIDPAGMGLLRAIKRSLDPDKLLNPGKIFD